MVYATCSILPDENSSQIAAFLQHHADAKLVETGDAQRRGGRISRIPRMAMASLR